MANLIKHLGIVENIDGAHIIVRIVQTSACSSCSIKGHCSASESKEKLIDIYNTDTSSYSIGDKVWVIGATSMGMQAVLLAFVIPFAILIFFLFFFMRITSGNEWFSALIALGSLIPYYIIVYLYRNKLSKKFAFSIEHINN